MAKIGKDIIGYKHSKGVKLELTNSQIIRNPDYRQKILDALRDSDRALNIAEVSRRTKINYFTCRTILMELLLAGEVERYESAHCLFYRVKK